MFDCSLVETKLTTIYTVIQYIETVSHFNSHNNYSETYRPIKYWCQIFSVSEKSTEKKTREKMLDLIALIVYHLHVK